MNRPTGQAGLAPADPCRLRGFGLVELLVVLAMATVLYATALPRLAATVHEHRLRGAAIHFRGLFRQVRARAAAEAKYIGVVFDEVDGDPVYSIYADGNANGIRRADIRRGIDVRIREPYRISETFFRGPLWEPSGGCGGAVFSRAAYWTQQNHLGAALLERWRERV